MVKKFLLILFIIFIVFIIIFIIKYTDKNYTLLFLDKNSNNQLMTFKLRDGETFKITFKHSVALTEVTEFYKIEKGEIILFEMDFYDQCAGLPTEPYENEKLILDGNVFRLINLKREYNEIIYGIIKDCDYRLFIKNKEINLSKIFGTRTLIIKVRRL